MYSIAHDLDLPGAKAVQEDLLAQIDAHGDGAFELDISDGAVTQVALQIGFAALEELRARHLKATPGPVLERHCARICDEISAGTTP